MYVTGKTRNAQVVWAKLKNKINLFKNVNKLLITSLQIRKFLNYTFSILYLSNNFFTFL